MSEKDQDDLVNLDDESEGEIEISQFCCADCEGQTWELCIGRTDNNRTMLIIRCANPDCMESKKEQLGEENEDLIVWKVYDITGQEEGISIPTLFGPIDSEPRELN